MKFLDSFEVQNRALLYTERLGVYIRDARRKISFMRRF